MSHPVVSIPAGTTLAEAARLMLENHLGGLPVVDKEGKICGIITESDFAAKEQSVPFSTFRAPQVLGHWLTKEGIENIYEAARNRIVDEIMSSPAITLNENDSVERAAELMLRHNINRIPVIRDEKPVGMIARHDLLRLLIDGAAATES